VFTGYLHEDFVRESGTPEQALRSFRADASPAEWQRFQREARQFLADTERVDFDDVRERLHALGCRWRPASREALVAVLQV
jgi:hypothetical protein